MMMCDGIQQEEDQRHIVEEWLRSLDLVQYTESFIDNGYDELEICKEIGDADLDAIGVQDQNHRDGILCSVRIMKDQGTSVVYYTLDPDYISAADYQGVLDYRDVGGGIEYEGDCCGDYDAVYSSDLSPVSTNTDEGLTQLDHLDCALIPPPPVPRCNNQSSTSLLSSTPPSGRGGSRSQGDNRSDSDVDKVVFLPLQLYSIIKDKLDSDKIKINQIKDKQQLHQKGDDLLIEDIATRYAHDLNTHVQHVIDIISQIRSHQPVDNHPAATNTLSGFTSVTSSPGHVFKDGVGLETSFQQFQHSSLSHISLDSDFRSQRSSSPLSQTITHDGGEDLAQTTTTTLSSDMRNPDHRFRKKGLNPSSTIGRFFKNVTLRKSCKKYFYKQHKGDPHASEITMPAEDRINLMILVKEGKLSMNEALEIVKQYEQGHKETGSDVSRSEVDLLHDLSSGSSSSADVASLCRLNSSPATSRPIPASQSVDHSLLTPRRSQSSTDDYFDPPTHLSPDDELIPGHFSTLHTHRTRSTSEHDVINNRKFTSVAHHPSVKSVFQSSQGSSHWLSPMVLRRQGHAEVINTSRSGERRGLYSSPFIKRKSGAPLKSGPFHQRPPPIPPHNQDLSQRPPDTQDRFGVARPLYYSPSRFIGGPELFSFRRCPPQSSAAVISGHQLSPHRVYTTSKSQGHTSNKTGSAKKVVINIDVHRSNGDTTPTDHPDTLKRTPTAAPVMTGESLDHHNRSNHKANHTGPHLLKESTTTTTTNPLVSSPVSHVINAAITSIPKEQRPFCESPDLGVGEDTSPTSTLDSTTSDDFKDSKYGSSSTMSVGSDASPILEHKRHHKNTIHAPVTTTKALRTKPFELIHPCNHGNSAGEECMSSDYDDHEESQRNSVIDVQTLNSSNQLLNRHHRTYHTAGVAQGSPPSRTPAMSTTSSDMSGGSSDDSPRRKRGSKRSHRPRTLHELLSRLSLQHLHTVLESNGFTSMSKFSELDEHDLDDLDIVTDQEKAKLLTAAQLVLDYHDTIDEGCVDDSQSPNTTASSRGSSHDNIPHISASLSSDGRLIKLMHTKSDPSNDIEFKVQSFSTKASRSHLDIDDLNGTEEILTVVQTPTAHNVHSSTDASVTFDTTIQMDQSKNVFYNTSEVKQIRCNVPIQTSESQQKLCDVSPQKGGANRTQLPIRSVHSTSVKSPTAISNSMQMSNIRDKV